jgi:hypothetical protein
MIGMNGLNNIGSILVPDVKSSIVTAANYELIVWSKEIRFLYVGVHIAMTAESLAEIEWV